MRCMCAKRVCKIRSLPFPVNVRQTISDTSDRRLAKESQWATLHLCSDTICFPCLHSALCRHWLLSSGLSTPPACLSACVHSWQIDSWIAWKKALYFLLFHVFSPLFPFLLHGFCFSVLFCFVLISFFLFCLFCFFVFLFFKFYMF